MTDPDFEFIQVYKLTPPEQEPFYAAVIPLGEGLGVASSRSGAWAIDPNINIADLAMPEQAFSDWDIEPIKAEDVKNLDISKTKDNRRTIDRSADIEYYTAEVLGPTRERTPEGFLICYDVPVARTGEMIYGPGETPIQVGADGRVKIQRDAKEVFAPKSMASLNGKPVTDDHPPVDVDPDNWRFYTRGVVVNPRRGEGTLADCLVADMIIFDADTIRDIELGKVEVSCGYNPDYVEFLDAKGDAVPGKGEQANIIYNHLALVDRGRCGAKCSIGDRKTTDTSGPNSFWSRRRLTRLRNLGK